MAGGVRDGRRFGLGPMPALPPPGAIPQRKTGDVAEVRAVSQAAEESRRAFCFYMRLRGAVNYGEREMPQWDGGITQFGTNRSNIWPRIAVAAAAVGASPWEFVAAFFAFTKSLKPQPNHLLSDQAQIAWSEYAKRTPADTLREFEFEQQRLQAEAVLHVQAGFSPDDSWSYALRDRSISARPVVRHTVARQRNLPAVAAELYDAAVMDYAMQLRFFSPTLDNIVAPEVQQAGRDMRQRLMAGV